MIQYGASLSVKQCRDFGIEPVAVLKAAIHDLQLRRFRLMSYWDEIEKQPGIYDFSQLDELINYISEQGCVITLCLGARQPRWPESHWPNWTKKMPVRMRDKKLAIFIAEVVQRYKDQAAVVSWQLENEALLKTFGEAGDFNRDRLKLEYYLVKQIDPRRPIIMTTSTSWGIPIRQPIPDIVGFSYYKTVYNKGAYRNSLYYPWVFKLRARLIKLINRRPSFIHELQAEPWGPSPIAAMPPKQQDISMSLEKLRANISYAKRIKLSPIDFWGLEWWYWRNEQGDRRFWDEIKQLTAQVI